MKYEDLVLLSKSILADDAKILIELLKPKLKARESIPKIIERNNEKIKCPNCKHTPVKNGTKNSTQRYYCKECKRSFSSTTNSMTYHTRESFDKWIKFIHCELLGLTLRQIEQEIQVSKTTIFSWRHKLYNAISQVKKKIRLSGTAEIDGTFVPINLKGTKPQNMPRASKKRGKSTRFNDYDNKSKGLSHQVCIMCAVDENDNMMFEITGVGPETKEMMMKINIKIRECTTLISDSKSAFRHWAKENQTRSITIKSYAEHKNSYGYTINRINQIHSEIKTFLSLKHGVSIRHLQGYLDMFLFKKLVNKLIEEDKDIYSFNKAVNSKNKLLVAEIFKKAIPIDLKKVYGDYNFGIFKR